ncbi:uncharacterized protein LOC101854078 [Aplysia californica]|uniref:Uncharacterized protein LOC101854078 n=1 Tax=Aplysia californica TaxID=6500 RepID=A0ABM0ZY89_APLCA|nr:uncharacterized protein LOC101854078 [Aplysia californica]
MTTSQVSAPTTTTTTTTTTKETATPVSSSLCSAEIPLRVACYCTAPCKNSTDDLDMVNPRSSAARAMSLFNNSPSSSHLATLAHPISAASAAPQASQTLTVGSSPMLCPMTSAVSSSSPSISPPSPTSSFFKSFLFGTSQRTLRPVSYLLLLFLLTFCSNCVNANGTFTNCGGRLEGPHGTIQTPGFPRPFPVPIRCRWVIQIPQDKKLVIYFTQFFLRHSFSVTEYDANFLNPSVIVKATGNYEDDNYRSIAAYSEYVALDLAVVDFSNIHLRVEEHLMEAHGFNITYTVIPKTQTIRNNTCSAPDCTFLGHCLASADYSTFSCVCFERFHGKKCDKGPKCDPDNGLNSRCKNGGRCSYAYGSLLHVCECTEGYTGLQCEIPVVEQECPALKCSHHCEGSAEEGNQRCACDKGFRLEDDRRTCVEEEIYHVAVELPVKEQTDLDVNLDKLLDNWDKIQRQCNIILELSGLRTTREFEKDTISSSTISFRFVIEKDEVPKAAGAVKNLVRSGKFFGVLIDKENVSISTHPVMRLLGVEKADEGPSLEGQLLTLICTARGSNSLQIRWFKDGRGFNLTMTHRNAWEIRLPETIEEKQISVLNVDGVTTYDSGQFTCEITDFGRSMKRSVMLEVLPHPRVVVTPLTISAQTNTKQTFRCIAPTTPDHAQYFVYTWYKNGRSITEADDEFFEELLPAGSRLIIPRATETSNYTCQVKNKAGISSKTVYLFVAKVNASQICPNNSMEGVQWTQAFGGFYDLQICPTDASKGTLLGVDDDGAAKRRCVCGEGGCAWTQPNYAHCHSASQHLVNLHDMLMKIQLGYQEVRLMDVFDDLYEIAQQARGRMFAGDLDISAKTVHSILTTAKDFPPLVHRQFASEELTDFLNILLEEAITMTDDEKGELEVGGRILQVTELMKDLQMLKLLNLTQTPFKTIGLSLLSEKPRTRQSEQVYETDSLRKRQIRRDIEKRKAKDGFVVNVSTTTQLMVMTYSHSILPLLERGSRWRAPDETYVSDVFSYIPLQKSEGTSDKLYPVVIPHNQAVNIKDQFAIRETTICLSWEREKRESTTGLWVNNTCTVVETMTNITHCLCPLPGHFTLIMVPVNKTVLVSESTYDNLPLILACIIALVFLMPALLLYLLAWRLLCQERQAIHFNFILAVICINIICLKCLLSSEGEVSCIISKILLQLFTLASFTFILLDAIQMLFSNYSRSPESMNAGLFKFLCIGWGVPILSVIFVILMMTLSGYDSKCSTWCWWSQANHHFYSVLSFTGIVIVGFIFVFVARLMLVSQWKDEVHFRDRRRNIRDIIFSGILLFLLIADVVMGILQETNSNYSNQVVFLVINVSLSLFILVMMSLLKKPVRLLAKAQCLRIKGELFGMCDKGPNVLINPANAEQHAAEVERIHEYCDRIDRERYTSEHKRQLRFLLNSSGSSGSSGAACSVPIIDFSSSNSAVHSAAHQNCANGNLDSGISEGTESEKSSISPPQNQPAIVEEQPPLTKSVKKTDGVKHGKTTKNMSASNLRLKNKSSRKKVCASSKEAAASSSDDSSNSLFSSSAVKPVIKSYVNMESGASGMAKDNAGAIPKKRIRASALSETELKNGCETLPLTVKVVEPTESNETSAYPDDVQAERECML